MSSEKPKKPVPSIRPEMIHFERIAMVSGKLDTTDEFISKPSRPARIKVDYGHRSGLKWSSKKVFARLYIDMQALDNKEKELGVSASYAFDFDIKVDNMTEFAVKQEDGSKQMHTHLGNTLMGIMFSTARGMVLERTKGTYLDGVILPVISPRDLLNKARS